MIIKTMDASFVRKCFLAGANAIDAKKEVINDLNVFPVPDGDTAQGIYGLLVAFLALSKVGILGGGVADISLETGLMIFVACLPIAIAGLLSAIHQGKTSVASIGIVAKKPEQFGKAMLFPAMVETYAILALLISILAVSGIQV